MADRVRCPHCGKSIVPLEKRVGVWQRRIPRKKTIPWIVSGATGLLMISVGGALFVLYALSSIGLAGATVAMLGCFLVGRNLFFYLRAARSKQLQQVCPVCKHHWIGQLQGKGATEALEGYFTDVEELRGEFAQLVAAPVLSRHLLVVHGVGGVGKSSLMRMFRLHCRKSAVPVALSSGDEAKSLVDVLSDWARDLAGQGLPLPNFTQTFHDYRAVQQKVEERAKAEQKSQGETSKAALKMAVQTAGGIASFIPLVGPALSIAVGGAGDTLVDWLHGFLNKEEIDLLLDPTDELTEAFLNDLVEALSRDERTQPVRRIVLLLDTIEQLMALSRWICALAQQVHPDVLLVLAGRKLPTWEQQWPGWTAQARVEELKPMTSEVMRELVHRYYATQRGGTPDPKQVDAIIQFARGLPIAVTAIVQLWVQYGLEDFQSVRAQVVADLVDRLTDGIPERVRPVLKAAATLRWFNEELLAIVLGEHAPGDDIYQELRRFPFVRPRKEGLALHDAVREHLDDNLRVHEPQRHHEMHQRAAAYFKAQLQRVKGEESADLALEELYHTMMADEDAGIKQFRKAAEELVRYQLLNQLRTLLNDVHNHSLQKENSCLWRQYYRARLRDLEGRRTDAMPLYREVAENRKAEPILRAYALCDIVWVTGRTDVEYKSRLLAQIRELFPEPEALPEPDAKLGFYLLEVGELYQEQGKSGSLMYLERALQLFERLNDLYWIAFTHNQIKYYYLNRGIWKESEKRQKQGQQVIKQLVGEQQQSYLQAELLAGVAVGWVRAGRYRETEENLRKALRITEQFERALQRIYFLRDLAFVVGLQGRVEESTRYFDEGIALAQQQDPLFPTVAQGFQGIVALKWSGVERGEQLLAACMSELRRHAGNKWDILNFLAEYGMLHEMKGDLATAEHVYRECLELRQFERWYAYVGALTGLVRVYAQRGEERALAPVLQEAEELAQQYEYNNYLAALRLTQGHLAWKSQDGDAGARFETALRCYQQALVYALRYNRFLLDEVLAGPPARTHLQALVPYCRTRGEEGQSMLLTLRDWWHSGLNDVGTARQESISLIPENISLLAGEQQARQQEPGDGARQQTVVEQLDTALQPVQ